MKSFRLLFLISAMFCSCSSQSKVAKDQDRYADYAKAKQATAASANEACGLYMKLANDSKFVLTDLAYVRALQVCLPATTGLTWERIVPSWMDKEKQLAFFKTITDPVEQALFIQKSPQFFLAPDRVAAYQKALAQPQIADPAKNTLTESLGNIAPRFLKDPQEKDFFRIARDYRSVRQFDKANQYLQRLVKSAATNEEEKVTALKELWSTNKLRRDQNKKLYMQSTRAWAHFFNPKQLTTPRRQQLYLDANLNLVRTVWTEEGVSPALNLLARLEKTLKGKTSLFDIHWLRARMLEEKKSYTESVQELERALKEKIPQWRDQEKVLWSLAWSYFKDKKFDLAETHLETLIQSKETSPFAKFKYLFWKAESLHRRNQNDAAKQAWEQICNEDLFGYYSLLAHYRLGRPLRDIVIPATPPPSLLSSDNDPLFTALIRTEELEMASRFLSQALPDLQNYRALSIDQLASHFSLYAQVKNYKYVFQVFNQLPYEYQRDLFLKIPQLLFPRPYDALIAEATKNGPVEPELIYAVMRQESSFDPRARSPMDAFGLLQLLPDVAKRLAKDSKILYTNYEDLYQEMTNIQLGSRLLKRQMDSFDNKFVLYIGSYNASSAAVRGWYNRRSGDELMFIEDIPYEETKAYVKLVFRNLVLYKKMKYGADFKDFPANLLKLEAPPAL